MKGSYDPTDKEAAFAKTLEWGIGKIPIGVLYQVKEPTYEEQIPQIQKRALVARPAKKRDIRELLIKYQ